MPPRQFGALTPPAPVPAAQIRVGFGAPNIMLPRPPAKPFGALTPPAPVPAAQIRVGFGAPNIMLPRPPARPFGARTPPASVPAAQIRVGFGGPAITGQIQPFSATGNSVASRSIRASRNLPQGQPGWGASSGLPQNQRSMGNAPNWHLDGEDHSWYPGIGTQPLSRGSSSSSRHSSPSSSRHSSPSSSRHSSPSSSRHASPSSRPPSRHASPSSRHASQPRGHTQPIVAAAGPSRGIAPSRGVAGPSRGNTQPIVAAAAGPPRGIAPSRGVAGPSRGNTPPRRQPQDNVPMDVDQAPVGVDPGFRKGELMTTSTVPPDMIMLQSHMKEAYTIMYHMTIKFFIKFTTIYDLYVINGQTTPGEIEGQALSEYSKLFDAELTPLCDTFLLFRETVVENSKHIDMSIHRNPNQAFAFETILNICEAQQLRSTIYIHDIYNKANRIITSSTYDPVDLVEINNSDYQQYIRRLITEINSKLRQKTRSAVKHFAHHAFARGRRQRLNYKSSSHYKLTRRRQPRRDYKLTRRRKSRYTMRTI